MLHMKNNPGASPMPKPAGRQRWLVLGLLCLIALVNNIDRLTLSIAAPAMQHELGFTATDIGLLGSAFSLFYAFGQLPSGWFVDRFGPRRLLGVSVVVWSAATAAMGTAHSFGAFLIARAWLGAAESPSLPSTNKIVTQWFPKKEQGIANASWDAALKVGPAFLTFALVFVVAEFGWRSMYLAAGVAGVVVAIVFLFFYRDVDRNTRLSREERAYIAHDGEVRAAADAVRVPWTAMFKRQSMWGMMAGFFCNLWVYQIFLVFIPMFIIEQFGVKFSSLGLAASVPWVGAIIGDIVSGIVSGKLAERSGWTTLKAKKVTIVAALLLQAIVLALLPLNAVFGQSAGLPVAVILMAFALGFNGGRGRACMVAARRGHHVFDGRVSRRSAEFWRLPRRDAFAVGCWHDRRRHAFIHPRFPVVGGGIGVWGNRLSFFRAAPHHPGRKAESGSRRCQTGIGRLIRK